MTIQDPVAAEGLAVPFWRSLLACPGCGRPLPDVVRCRHCGLEYADQGGTPVLLHPKLQREFTIHFGPGRSFIPRDEQLRYFTDPPIEHDLSKMPYHMDAAHARIVSELTPGTRVLEIGCGGGQCRPWFHDKSIEYVGVDISKTRVYEWLRTFGGPDLLCDSHFLPFQSESFDVVYTAALTEHLACPALAAREIFRVLKRGGRYLGNVSFLEPWHDNSYYHMTPLGVLELLQSAGFEPQHIWPGRGYSGFYAICSQGFRGPLKSLRHAGQLAYLMHRAQARGLATARRLRGRPPVPDLFERARVAGATDWIARKP